MLKGLPAVRYACSNRELKQRVCPPYDLVGDGQAKELSQVPYSFVYLEKPRSLYSQYPYERARRTYEEWLQKGVLVREPIPRFYLFQQQFEERESEQTVPRRRRMLVGLLPLETAEKVVFPHERTLPAPRRDRMQMLRTTGLQVSGVFLVGNIAEEQWNSFFQETPGEPLHRVEVGGVRHELFTLQDPPESLFQNCRFLIADGHHRYESARRVGKKGGVDSVFVYITNLSEPLPLLPIHRAFPRKKRVSRRLITQYFVEDAAGSVGYWDCGELKVRLRCRQNGLFAEVKALDQLLAKASVGKEELEYLPGFHSLAEKTGGGGLQAFELSQHTVQEVFEQAMTSGVLPPKTTFFYPKILSGLLFHAMW